MARGPAPPVGASQPPRAVIRGETDHYDWVCAESARGIQDVQLRTGVPCAFADSGRHVVDAVVALARLRAQLR